MRIIDRLNGVSLFLLQLKHTVGVSGIFGEKHTVRRRFALSKLSANLVT